MRKIAVLFLALGMAACTGNDPEPAALVPAGPKLATSITYKDNGYEESYELRYDANQRLCKILTHDESDNNTVYTLEYDASDRLVFVENVNMDFSDSVAFAYDASGRLCSWTHNGSVMPVYYNQGVYAVPIGQMSTYFSCNDLNDVTMISNGNPAIFSYDETKNGVFANVVGNYQIMSVFFNGRFTRFGKKPLVSAISASPLPRHSYTLTNTYDDDGYVVGFESLRGDGVLARCRVVYNR